MLLLNGAGLGFPFTSNSSPFMIRSNLYLQIIQDTKNKEWFSNAEVGVVKIPELQGQYRNLQGQYQDLRLSDHVL
jgi:hypothetical protein